MRPGRERFPETIRQTVEVADKISDLAFTDAYRVPFQFSRFVRTHLKVGAFLQSTEDGEAVLVSAVLEAVGSARRSADLFAGLGTFARIPDIGAVPATTSPSSPAGR